VSPSRPLPPIAQFLFKEALVQALTDLARTIEARDGCTSEEAIDRAMKRYDELVQEVNGRRQAFEASQKTARAFEATPTLGKPTLGKPTLTASLGERVDLRALRDKLPSK